MIASLRFERGIKWEDLSEDERVSAYAWWHVRGRDGGRAC